MLSSSVVAAAADDGKGTAQPVLWRDPGAVESRDMLWGSGSEARRPAPPFKLVRENEKGKSPKVVVKDAHGTAWDVKFGAEAHAEVIANRLVWALGYMVQEMYYVPEGTLTGHVDELKRAAE